MEVEVLISLTYNVKKIYINSLKFKQLNMQHSLKL